MAAMLSSKRALSSTLFRRLISPVRSISAAPPAVRSFNTNAQMRDTEDERSIDNDRRSDQTSLSPRGSDFFSDVLDPFFPSRSLSQVLNLMDQMMENPFSAMSKGGAKRGWDVKEDNDALYMRIDMPGLGKEDVKISVEQNTLIIRGEGEKETKEEDSVRRYSSRIDLPPNLYNIEGIKAEMKNGVLRVVVPKVKDEERKNVFQVKVE